MEKEELTLEEAREELGKWGGILEAWSEFSPAEKFAYYYRLSQISAPFVDMSHKFTTNPKITKEEQEWNKILVDVVYFHRGIEKIYKAKGDEVEEIIRQTEEILAKLLIEYDNFK